MDISVLVPVYNTEKFLTRCLDSIFNQVFTGSFEVIAIEDCSADNSLQLLYEYQKKEDRLKIIKHVRNQKLSKARATGMNAATGNYIMHVDSDDWLLPGAFENLFKKSKETDADIVVFNFSNKDTKGKITYFKKIEEDHITTDKPSVQKYFLGATFNKFVKRSITENMIYGDSSINTGEDLLYSTEILLRAKSIYLLPETYYIYYINKESSTQTATPIHILQTRVILLRVLRKITLAYNADKLIIDNILLHIERIIYCFSLQLLFSNSATSFDARALLDALNAYPEITQKRLNSIALTLNKKRYALYYTYINFGAKYTLSRLIICIYKRMKYRNNNFKKKSL